MVPDHLVYTLLSWRDQARSFGRSADARLARSIVLPMVPLGAAEAGLDELATARDACCERLHHFLARCWGVEPAAGRCLQPVPQSGALVK